jgi:hypothetical protein
VYRFHDYKPEEFCQEFSIYLRKINSKNLIVTGDVNINILENSNDKNNYLEMISAHGLQSVINDITRPSSGSCVDHIMLRLDNEYFEKCAVSVKYFGITDHSMIGLIVNDIGQKNMVKSEIKTHRTRLNYNNLKIRLSEELWESVYMEKNLDNAYENFISILNDHIHQCTEQVPIKKSEKYLKPWMTKSLLKTVKSKNKANARHHKHPRKKKLKNKPVYAKIIFI